MTCTNDIKIDTNFKFAFDYKPDWFDEDNVKTYFYSDINVLTTFVEMKKRVQFTGPYSEILSSVLNYSGDMKDLVVSLMATNVALSDPYFFPLAFMVQVQECIGNLVDVCFDFLQAVITDIFSNPNIKLVLFPQDYESPEIAQYDMDTYSPGLKSFYRCDEIKEPFFVDPVYEIDERTTPMAQAYHPLDRRDKSNGQFKLFVAFQQFIENHPQLKSVIYVGASPGINIAPVAIQFPEITFYLNDLRRIYAPGLVDLPNVLLFDSITQLEVDRTTTAYYSDVYNHTRGRRHFDLQLQYLRLIPANYVSIKRVHEWGERDLLKVKGSRLMTQVFLGPNGSELREVFQWDGSSISYESIPMAILERMIMYYNMRVRGSHYSITSPLSGCNCHDCVVGGVAYLRGLVRTRPHLRHLYISAFENIFNRKIKRALGRRRRKYAKSFQIDIFGDVAVSIVNEDPIAVDPTVMRIGESNYYVPPYRYYPNSGSLTVMLNGRLRRADTQYGMLYVSCPKHFDPGEFPSTVLLDHCLTNDLLVNFNCGCRKPVQVRGRYSVVT